MVGVTNFNHGQKIFSSPETFWIIIQKYIEFINRCLPHNIILFYYISFLRGGKNKNSRYMLIYWRTYKNKWFVSPIVWPAESSPSSRGFFLYRHCDSWHWIVSFQSFHIPEYIYIPDIHNNIILSKRWHTHTNFYSIVTLFGR